MAVAVLVTALGVRREGQVWWAAGMAVEATYLDLGLLPLLRGTAHGQLQGHDRPRPGHERAGEVRGRKGGERHWRRVQGAGFCGRRSGAG